MRFPSAILATIAGLAPALAAPLSYNRDIRPILSENCFACHGPDKAKREAKLRLDVREAALDKEAFVPGDTEESELVYRITTDDEDDLMPPPDSHKTLSAEEKKMLTQWIAEGAKYEAHWAYLRPERPPVPAMGEEHPVDNFVVAGLKAEGLALSPPAAPHTLARRLSFDLTGLPPAVHGTKDPAAAIDGLLSSPAFGERMAVFWLDLARYADSVGYHGDQERDVTPYRDYVIDSFNANKPFDQFTREQLAGDLLDNPGTEQYIATTFNRVNQISSEGGIQDAEYIAKYYAERVRTTSVAFLGSTMGCAECHDHKFDPFTAKDFYAMQAFFADIFEKGAYNNDGSYNTGADIRNHPGFKLTTWGVTMPVPEPAQTAELERLAAAKKSAEERFHKSTPELEAAFTAWLTGLRTQLRDRKARDVAILDDKELNFGNTPIVKDPVYSGSIARGQKGAGMVQHIADASKKPVTVAAGDRFFAWILFDPNDPPQQLMLQFHADGNWNHRAWWGADLIPFGQGSDGAGHHRAGDLPVGGKWVRLEVSAATVGLPAGKKVTQFAFSQHGGTVVWDLFGRHTDDPNATMAELPEAVRKALLAGDGKELTPAQNDLLLAHFRDIVPALEPVRKEIADLTASEKKLNARIRTTLVTVPATPREVRVLPRGNWTDRSGEVVQPAVPGFLQFSDPGSAAADEVERLTRLDLANWIASRDNPLTARAFVNRVWALFFGTGLSRDLQDLGNQGRWPTHLDLLDWLAVEFMESGWDVKHLVHLIVTSKAYRQGSHGAEDLRTRDPYNKLYARQNARRLPAEFVRDNALAVSGLLNREVGGSSARPYQPPGYYSQLNFPKREYAPDTDARQYRRGVYMHWQRTFLHPMLKAFDAPVREECTASRTISNTPLQALDLLNDPTFVEAARVLAEDLVRDHVDFASRLEIAFQRVFLRQPTSGEAGLLDTLYARQLARYRESPADAKALLAVGLHPAAGDLDPADLAATTAVTRALFNLHESITIY